METDSLPAAETKQPRLRWSWIPGKSVGPFSFGELVDTAIRDFGLVRLSEEGYLTDDWDTYEIPGYESRVFVVNGVIENVLCCDSLLYKGSDLIGLTLVEATSVLGKEDEVKKDMGPWDAVYYFESGLTLWIANGVVESATCEPQYQSGPLVEGG
jgi:hypothetical protein